MDKKFVTSVGLIGLLAAVVIIVGVLTRSATADNTKVWINDFKGGYDERENFTKQKPLKACECSTVTKLGDNLNYVWNCRCGSKQCVIAGRYDGSNMSCFKFAESLLK